ncbi:MAG: hypothetical protein IJ880_00555 [Bacilli bacterium]|nr:hypothetical protein [Bacilli bacterium]
MSLGKLHFQYINNLKNKDIPIVDILYNMDTYMIDYSASQVYNNSLSNIYNSFNLQTQRDTYYIEGDSYDINEYCIYSPLIDPVTQKQLFFQYQPKYDIVNNKNTQVLNSNEQVITYSKQYAYLREKSSWDSLEFTDKLLTYESQEIPVLYDDLNNRTKADFDINNDYNYNNLSDMGYDKIQGFTAYDVFRFAPNILMLKYKNLEINDILSFYIAFNRELSESDRTILEFGNLKFKIDINEFEEKYLNVIYNDNEIPLIKIKDSNYDKWQRIDVINKDTLSIKVHFYYDNTYYDGTDISPFQNQTKITESNDLVLYSFRYYQIFDLAIYKNEKTPYEHIYTERYSRDIVWKFNPPQELYDTYRVRLLFNKKDFATLNYSYILNGELHTNQFEYVTYEYLYDKTDYVYLMDSNNARVMFYNKIQQDIILNNSLIINTLLENINNIKIVNENNKIYSNVGNFYGNEKNSSRGNIYYNIPESYSRITDSKKVIKEKALIVDNHTIKITPFLCDEYLYPDYKIPNIHRLRCNFNIQNPDIYSLEEIDSLYNLNGLNIYVNNKKIDNSNIVGIDKTNGYIKFSFILNNSDVVLVDYFKYTKNKYYLNYPILNKNINQDYGGINDVNNIKIYILPNYNNYKYYHNGYTLSEALCYQTDSFKEGLYRSCIDNSPIFSRSNTTLQEEYGDSKLLIDDFDIENMLLLCELNFLDYNSFTDSRVNGGGIKEEVKENYKLHKSFLNIGTLPNGYPIYKNIIFIKLPKKYVDDLQEKYYKFDYKAAMLAIYNEIQKWNAAGTLPIFIDENNVPYDEKYNCDNGIIIQ